MIEEWEAYERMAREFFEKRGEIEVTQQWLEDHPPPREWKAGPWAWAYTEKPLMPLFLKRLLGATNAPKI